MNFFHLFILVATMLIMEFAVMLFHKHVMHGIGWGWHRSHHLPHESATWEANDLYAVVFTVLTILLFAFGSKHAALWWSALGITFYGLLYAILHDVLIHRRVRIKWRPTNRYLQRLTKAHHLHHAVKTRDGGVSFGFLYTPPVESIRRQLRSKVRKT
ncbi:MAG: sterol desaturase family protein [Bdellovibrionales bacterium]|nr:sterol desaturase family protein [Massilia sp.]